MTDNFDLWTWFQDSVHDPRLRADAEVVLLGADGNTERARFQLSRCVPVKLKAPALNAKDGQIAIEELQIAYETLKFVAPKPGGDGKTVGALARPTDRARSRISARKRKRRQEGRRAVQPGDAEGHVRQPVRPAAGRRPGERECGRQFVGAGTTKLALSCGST